MLYEVITLVVHRPEGFLLENLAVRLDEVDRVSQVVRGDAEKLVLELVGFLEPGEGFLQVHCLLDHQLFQLGPVTSYNFV